LREFRDAPTSDRSNETVQLGVQPLQYLPASEDEVFHLGPTQIETVGMSEDVPEIHELSQTKE
jgi:hypothetical protein